MLVLAQSSAGATKNLKGFGSKWYILLAQYSVTLRTTDFSLATVISVVSQKASEELLLIVDCSHTSDVYETYF